MVHVVQRIMGQTHLNSGLKYAQADMASCRQYYTSDSKSAYQEVHPQLGLCNAHNLEKKPPTM